MKELKQNEFFEFYPVRFLLATTGWSVEAVGVYTRFLCHQWQRYSIPIALPLLKKIAGTEDESVINFVISKFNLINNDHYLNPTLEEVRQEQIDKKRKYQNAGIENAKKRWMAMPQHPYSVAITTVADNELQKNENKIPPSSLIDNISNNNTKKKRGSGGKTLTEEFCREKMDDPVYINGIKEFFLDHHHVDIHAGVIRGTIQSLIDYCNSKNKWKSYHDLTAVVRMWIRRDLKPQGQKTRADRFKDAASQIPTIE